MKTKATEIGMAELQVLQVRKYRFFLRVGEGVKMVAASQVNPDGQPGAKGKEFKKAYIIAFLS